MVYIILLFGLIATAGLCKNNKRLKIGLFASTTSSMYVFFWGTILVLLVALRSTDVGNDTHMYEYIFNSMKSYDSYLDWVAVHTYTSGTDHGYYILCFLISRFADYRVFLVISAILTVSPVIYVVNRFSKNIPLSLILYVCFPYYTFCMSGLRQSYALALISIAYCFVKERKVWHYLIVCVVAFSFHSSSLLFVPVYWITKIRNTKKTRIVIVLAILLCFVFRNDIWNVATLFARQQYTSNDAGGVMMCIFMILSAILGIYYRRVFLEPNADLNTSEKELLYLQVLAAMIVPLSLINSAISRIYFYYHLFFILYVPVLLQSIRSRNERLIILLGYLFIAAYFLVSIVMNPIQHYNPYLFMWQ